MRINVGGVALSAVICIVGGTACSSSNAPTGGGNGSAGGGSSSGSGSSAPVGLDAAGAPADLASQGTDGGSGNSDSGASGGSGDASPAQGSDAASLEGGATVGPFPGLTSLFDGTTLNGWMQSKNNWWSVKDATIDGLSMSGGQIIITNDDYGDFRLIVSSRMPKNIGTGQNTGTGHLGICFWGGRNPVGNYNNCKLYIPPNPWNWDYKTGRGLVKATFTTTMTMDPTVWHQTELLCHLAAGHCVAAVDGKLIMTYDEHDLSSIKKGPVGLQIHSGNSEVQYKDIYVDPAPPATDKLLTVM